MPLINISIDEYEFTTFKNAESLKKQQGYLVRARLAVSFSPFSDGWKVYRLSDGRPLINWRFHDSTDAISFANWFADKYSEYFPIWDEYPSADLFQLCAWSVRNGLDIAKIIRDAKHSAEASKICQY